MNRILQSLAIGFVAFVSANLAIYFIQKVFFNQSNFSGLYFSGFIAISFSIISFYKKIP